MNTHRDDEPKTVVVIDDHAMVAEALHVALSQTPDLRPVGSATTVDDGLRLVASAQPDVVITDLRFADGDVVGRLPAMRAACPTAKILVITGSSDEASFLRSVAAGVEGFLDKLQRLDELVDGIRRALRGELVIAPRFLPSMVRRTAGDRSAAAELSRRELEVLQLLSKGTPTGEMATTLHISVNTVRNHVNRILVKLGVHSRLEAVHVAVQRGLIARTAS